MVFILAKKLDYPEEEIQDLAKEMVEELKSMERYSEAAQVCKEYTQDMTEAISLFTYARFAIMTVLFSYFEIESRKWKEAVSLCQITDQADLIQEVVAPAAASCAEGLLEDFDKAIDKIQKYSDRLKDVQARKQALGTLIGDTGTESL